MRKAAAVIVNYNGLKALGSKLFECIKSVVETDFNDLEVIVVDNGSSDGSAEAIEEEFRGEVRVLRLRRNYGYAGAVNRAARLCRDAEYLAILNSDVIVERSWLRRIVEVMEEEMRIATAQPLIAGFDGKVQSVGCFVGRYGLCCLRGTGLSLDHVIDKLRKVKFLVCGYAHGSAFVTRTRVFQELGGLDERFFMYFEETDYCVRCWLHGYWVVVVPHSVVWHLGGATIRASNIKGIKLLTRNSLLMLARISSSPLDLVKRMLGGITLRLMRSTLLAFAEGTANPIEQGVLGVLEALRDFKHFYMRGASSVAWGYRSLEKIMSLYPDVLSLVPTTLRSGICRL